MLQKILILDNELAVREKFSQFLRRSGYVTVCTSSNREALQLIKASSFDLILCDCELKDTYPVDFLLKMKSLAPKIPIISISDTNSVQTAVELMKSGAFYFLLKPVNPEILLDVICSALNDSSPKVTLEEGQQGPREINNNVDKGNFERNTFSIQQYPYIKGVSRIANKLYKTIDLVAPTDYTVIIYGETGTGKESIAKLIHDKSKRGKMPFIAVDCGSLSKELAASELFGHEKGAFTGALQSREGAFKLAEGGTLFLDEIGNLSYDVQLLLLRAIQERVIRKVGSVAEIPVNFRLIVASNEDLNSCVDKKKFRDDLYHRLNEFTLPIPSLSKRMEDLPLFVESFIVHASARLGKDIKMPDDEAMRILQEYSWPGNIRELLNTIKKACLFTTDGDAITQAALPIEIVSSVKGNRNSFTDELTSEPEEPSKKREISGLSDKEELRSDQIEAKAGFCLKDIASFTELHKIITTLKQVKFNKSKAAELLNIDRKTLYNKLKRVNL